MRVSSQEGPDGTVSVRVSCPWSTLAYTFTYTWPGEDSAVGPSSDPSQVTVSNRYSLPAVADQGYESNARISFSDKSFSGALLAVSTVACLRW
jgi:hypothetical protein